jgi:hypothetical protein
MDATGRHFDRVAGVAGVGFVGFPMAGVRTGATARWDAGTGLLAAVLPLLAATASPYATRGANRLALPGPPAATTGASPEPRPTARSAR